MPYWERLEERIYEYHYIDWGVFVKSDRNTLLSANILIVDDKPVNVLLLESMLSIAGYSNIHSTTDSRNVRHLYKTKNFDLVLLDIRMPHLDGFQVMEILASDSRDGYLPILILTAHHDMETRIRALELGAKDFVTKPFDNFEVLNRIENMLEVRELYNQQKNQSRLLEQTVIERTKELYLRNRELEETRLDIIRCLGRAGEYRDNETGFHVIRMSKTCEVLALAAGWDESQAKTILHASPMHDVGKIGIPDHILLKPSSFDTEEWEIMKKHVDIGVEIIGDQPSELMQMAASIALNHHEKWDGSGYPQGLKGEEIPIEGRISAICDVFDALTSVRCYKPAWPTEDAVDLITNDSGTHFDPELVGLFLKSIPFFLAIQHQYPD